MPRPSIGCAGAAMLPEILVEHMRGLGEGRVDVAERDLVGGDDVDVELAPDRRRVRRAGLAAVGDRAAAPRSRPRPARRRPRRGSGCRRSRSRPARRHRTPRRRRARTATAWSSGVPELECRIMRRCDSTGARSSSVSTACTPGSASAARCRRCGSAHADAGCARTPRAARPAPRCRRRSGPCRAAAARPRAGQARADHDMLGGDARSSAPCELPSPHGAKRHGGEASGLAGHCRAKRGTSLPTSPPSRGGSDVPLDEHPIMR